MARGVTRGTHTVVVRRVGLVGDSTVSGFSPTDRAGVECHALAATPAQYRRAGAGARRLLLWPR